MLFETSIGLLNLQSVEELWCESKEGGRGLRTVHKGHCKEERTNSFFVFMLDKV